VLSEPRWFPVLDVALLIAEDGRHSFAIDQIEELLRSQWVGQRGADTRDLLRLAATSRSVDALRDRQTVTIDSSIRRGGLLTQGRNTSVHPLDAVLFLSTPFQVIVENEWFDGGFILWMAKGLGFTQLIRAYHQHRFTFRHAGGKDSIVRSARVFSESVWPRSDRTTHRAFRQWMCIVLDNDARAPSDDPNRAIVEESQSHVIFVHQLQRRSIESYLPRKHLLPLDSGVPFGRKVNALFRMTDVQRRYYHMKRGFRFTRSVAATKANFMASGDVTAGQKALYADLGEDDWNLLMDGFGRSLTAVFIDPQRRPNTNDPDLVTADSRAELLNLFRSIYESI
jgi:hypothetical protein